MESPVRKAKEQEPANASGQVVKSERGKAVVFIMFYFGTSLVNMS